MNQGIVVKHNIRCNVIVQLRVDRSRDEIETVVGTFEDAFIEIVVEATVCNHSL